jgi:hypothetical protein
MKRDKVLCNSQTIPILLKPKQKKPPPVLWPMRDNGKVKVGPILLQQAGGGLQVVNKRIRELVK